MEEQHKIKVLAVIDELYPEYVDNIDGLLENLEMGFIFGKYESNIHYLREEYRKIVDEYINTKLL